MKSAIHHLVLFFIATEARNIPRIVSNNSCMNTIRNNLSRNPASRMITRSQNRSSHHWKKKNSTERTILPIEHFKPALLPILSFIIPNDRIAHWKISRPAKWKNSPLRISNKTSVFEPPYLFVFYFNLKWFEFFRLIFSMARQSLKTLSRQGFWGTKWPYSIRKSHRLVRIG